MNRQWLLHERPVGMIAEHFKYVETDIPEPMSGADSQPDVLVRPYPARLDNGS